MKRRDFLTGSLAAVPAAAMASGDDPQPSTGKANSKPNIKVAADGDRDGADAKLTDHEMVQQLLRIKDQAPIAVDAEKCALVVVDVQRFFARPEYAFGRVFEKMVPGVTAEYFRRVNATVLPNIQALLTCFRDRKLPVIYFAVGSHAPDGRDLPGWMREFDRVSLKLNGKRVCPPVGDPSGAIEDRVAPRPGEVVLVKSSSGPSASTNLHQVLRNLGVQSLVVCGLTTAVCVTQTAREMADLSFQVIVADDACTELSDESHRAALFMFALIFGRVRPTRKIVELLGPAKAEAEPNAAPDPARK